MNKADRFERGDWWIAAVFFLLALVLYVPFRSRMAYHWDSAEFTIAIRDYNVALSQPHPPGFFLYVMLGRLVNVIVGDPHASLVWVSVLAGSGLAAVMVLLGTAMFGRRTGIAAGLFAMTSPPFWFYSCVALTYVPDAFLVCVTVLWCWRAIQHGASWEDAVIVGILLAVTGGVRQQTVPGLLPVVLFTFWKARTRRASKLVLAGCVSAVGALVWLVPMTELSGGLLLYWRVVRQFSAFVAPRTLLGGGWSSAVWNIFFIGAFCWEGLLLGAAMLGGGLWYRVFRMNPQRKRAWDYDHATVLQTLALWIVPMMTLAVAVSYTDGPGHVFCYLSGLLLLAALAAGSLRRNLFIAATAAVVVVNATTFLVAPASWDGALFHLGLNARTIRKHDEQLAQTILAVRSQYNPSEAVVCHARGFLLFGMRHFQLYLPEFEQYQLASDHAMLAPPGKPMLSVQQGRWEFVSGIERGNKRVALLIVPPEGNLEVFNVYGDTSRATPVMGSGGTVYAMPLSDVVP